MPVGDNTIENVYNKPAVEDTFEGQHQRSLLLVNGLHRVGAHFA